MPVKKILPLAKKMGENNFLMFKNYVKNLKTLKPGESEQINLQLKNITIIDTINFTVKNDKEVDIKGFKNLLKEIHRMYFPRAADEDTTKLVSMSYTKNDNHTSTLNVKVDTNDKFYQNVGNSLYKLINKGKELILDLETRCEDFGLKLKAKINLENSNLKEKQNLNINFNRFNSITINEKGDDVILSMSNLPNQDIPEFYLNANISKTKFEHMFSEKFDQALPDLIAKSGIKF